MTFGIVVFGIVALLVILLVACVINADEVEKHDEAVRYRWSDFGESEPPEWADPEKWYESEGRNG